MDWGQQAKFYLKGFCICQRRNSRRNRGEESRFLQRFPAWSWLSASVKHRLRCLMPSAGHFKKFIYWATRRWESVPCSFWFPTSRRKPDSCRRTESTGSVPGSSWAPGFGWSRRWCAVACSRSPESRLPGQISADDRTPALWPSQRHSNTKDCSLWKSPKTLENVVRGL